MKTRLSMPLLADISVDIAADRLLWALLRLNEYQDVQPELRCAILKKLAPRLQIEDRYAAIRDLLPRLLTGQPLGSFSRTVRARLLIVREPQRPDRRSSLCPPPAPLRTERLLRLHRQRGASFKTILHQA